MMSRDEALDALQDVRTALHDQFPDHRARLEQLDAHLATVGDVVGHIFDEAERHAHDPTAHAKAIGEYVRKD